MKKLVKLQINPERIIKNEGLMELKGGIGDSYCSCRNNGIELCSDYVVTCDFCRNYCNNMCWDWTELICAGY